MRDQAILQKVGNRSGMGNGRRSASTAQRPNKRERGSSKGGLLERLRGALGYLHIIFKLTLAVALGVLLFLGYRAAASANFFQVRSVEVQGTARVSNEEVQSLIRRDVSKTGVWNADLNELSEKLERLTWVRSAVISRVLPDGLRVRIVERVPVAVVRTVAGRFRWVDDEAVQLGEMLPSDQMPTFFVRGLNEENSETARHDNPDRMRIFLSLQRESDAAGLSERISEVNVSDVRDVRVQLAGADSQIELRLGSQDIGKRLQEGLKILDQQRQLPRGQFISYIDLSYGKRVVGFISGAHVSTTAAESETDQTVNNTPGAPTPEVTTKEDARKKSEKATRQKEKPKDGSSRGAE